MIKRLVLGLLALLVLAVALNTWRKGSRQIDDQQLPAGLQGVAREMSETLAPEASGINRVALSNLWLFGPLVQEQLEAGASTHAMLRTTTALTIVNAGNEENVLPGRAEATVNFRLLPGDSLASVQQHVKEVIGDDRFERTVRELFPGTIGAPGLVGGGTASQHFGNVSDHIYKFSPVRAKPEDLPRFHGTNERITTANLAELIAFYHRLLSQGAV
jgi:carboxypeptidase PM20D1